MPAIGVVLGAGGIVGAAYHAGVLTALARAGFDARRADIIVGTSAGAGVAATVRAGFPPGDLAARALGEALSPEAAAVVGTMSGPPVLDLRPRSRSRFPRPASPGLLLRAALRPTTALAGLLPAGTVPTDQIGERIEALYRGRHWPDRQLWICAVDLDSGRRVVFGRDETGVRVGTAVEASSAIPGFFRPVEWDGRRFVDGGVHSPTNADLLAGSDLDLVVVVSPMSVTSSGATSRSARAAGRPLFAQRLAGEIGTLRRAGTAVLTFQPTADDTAAMGPNGMDARRRETTARTALASAQDRLADPDVADRLRTLRAVT